MLKITARKKIIVKKMARQIDKRETNSDHDEENR